MDDIFSHFWDISDTVLLDYFNSHFLNMQSCCRCQLQPKMNLTLTLTLSKRRYELESVHHIPEKRLAIGKFGVNIVLSSIPKSMSPWIQLTTSR